MIYCFINNVIRLTTMWDLFFTLHLDYLLCQSGMCVAESGIKGRDKQLPTDIMGCNYFSLLLIPGPRLNIRKDVFP